MKKYGKIYILGASGSGKSFLGNKLSDKLKVPHYELDDLYFIRKYDKPRSYESRAKKAKKLWAKNKWILDGGGGLWNRDAMKHAELVIWLQTPFRIRSWRLFKRYIHRKGKYGETLKDCLGLIKLSGEYRFGKKHFHYEGHKIFLDKNNINYIIIKNKKQLEKLYRRKQLKTYT